MGKGKFHGVTPLIVASTLTIAITVNLMSPRHNYWDKDSGETRRFWVHFQSDYREQLKHSTANQN